MSEDLRVVVSLHASPGKAEAVKSAAMACVAPSRAEEDNLSYVANVDVNERSRFVIQEHWKDMQARERHLKSDHFREFSRAVGGDMLSEHLFYVLCPI
jgi:quinol monooxygenase YgiN